MHETTERIDFIRESSFISDEWSESKKSIKKEIWKQVISGRAEKTSPLSQSGKSKEKWQQYLKKWKAAKIPDSHLFGDLVRVMFVEKIENSSFMGYLICMNDDHFMTHPRMIFQDSRNQKYQMTISDITEKDHTSPSLFFLFRK